MISSRKFKSRIEFLDLLNLINSLVGTERYIDDYDISNNNNMKNRRNINRKINNNNGIEYRINNHYFFIIFSFFSFFRSIDISWGFIERII